MLPHLLSNVGTRTGCLPARLVPGRPMLAVLGGLAKFAPALIRTRTSEGRERARSWGVPMSQQPKLTPHQRSEALSRGDAREALVEIACSYAVSHSTISRLCYSEDSMRPSLIH